MKDNIPNDSLKFFDKKNNKYSLAIEKLNNKGLPYIDKSISNKVFSSADLKYDQKFNKTRTLSDNINNMYLSIGAILKSDRSAAEKCKNQFYNGRYGYITISDNKNKQYKYQIANVGIPFTAIIDMVNKAMRYIDLLEIKEYSQLEDVYNQVVKYFYDYYWYTLETTPMIVMIKSNETIGETIQLTKTIADNNLERLYYLSRYMTNGVMYNSVDLKARDELNKKYSYDKKAIEIINKTFDVCDKYVNAGIEMNNKAFEQSETLLGLALEQMKDIYSKIK